MQLSSDKILAMQVLHNNYISLLIIDRPKQYLVYEHAAGSFVTQMHTLSKCRNKHAHQNADKALIRRNFRKAASGP